MVGLMGAAFVWSAVAFAAYSAPVAVFLVLLALPVAANGLSRIAGGKAWDVSVTIVARVHVLVGVLLAISLLIRL